MKTAVQIPLNEWEKIINDYKHLQRKLEQKTGFVQEIEEIKLENHHYKALIKKDGNWWIGWIKEIPGVNCQESTREELLESLRITLKEALEFNKNDAISTAGEDFIEESITL